MSALQIQRNLELGSYRTAWFMCHRIRWATTQKPMAEMLSGVVEVDETFVGGKEKGEVRRGRPKTDSKKTPVAHIDPSMHVVTNEFPVYYQMKDSFAAHSEINHRAPSTFGLFEWKKPQPTLAQIA